MTKLHPDLVPYAYDDPHFGRTVDHHFVRLIPLDQPFNHPEFKDSTAWVNASYLQSSVKAAEALSEGDHVRFIRLHEKPYRLKALLGLDLQKKLTGNLFWPLVGYVWVDVENIRQSIEEWRKVWSDERPFRELAMQPEDQDAFKNLPDMIPVWRGIANRRGKKGMSWTTCRDTAIWFAHYSVGRARGNEPHLVSGVVSKSQARAYFTMRNEFEIVLFPEELRKVTIEVLPAITDDEFNKLKPDDAGTPGIGWLRED